MLSLYSSQHHNKATWTAPLLRLQCRKRRFVSEPVFPTSLAGDPWIPPSLTAAPAAGGWGIHGSRPVYSVGVGRSSAGGAMEVEASVAVRLVSICSFSDGGVLRSSGVRGSTSLSSSISGFVELVKPHPVPASRRCLFRVLAGEDVLGQDGVAAHGAGWRRSAEEYRLPGRRGVPPSPSLWRIGGGFCRCSVLLQGDEATVQEGPTCNFFVFLDCSVRILA